MLSIVKAPVAKLHYSGTYPSLTEFVDHGALPRQLKVGILTQDIFGPVRNAGIGTAYMHAATFLAEQGFDITIIYTQGSASHTQPIQYWIGFYKERGIKFICAKDDTQITAPTPALRWSYNGFMQLLSMPRFDIIHSSECGASPYYSLLAKRNRGLFATTQFCIKTSSPHLWSREGNETLIGLDNGPMIAMAERYSVEQADLIIAPSQHMLNWMVEHGYTLPQNICVHPNIMPMSMLSTDRAPAIDLSGPIEISSGAAAPLQPAPEKRANRRVDEIVFFGRLEPRKGIRLFADALALAVPQMKTKPKVTFLGKIRSDEIDFNFESFLTDFQERTGIVGQAILDKDAAQAISYLKEEGRVAVIPSLLDNSPFTVYEALVSGFPFIASNVGGIPELIHPGDRSKVLFAPRPNALAAALTTLVAEGVILARLSFEPSESLEVWRTFHLSPKIPPLPLPHIESEPQNTVSVPVNSDAFEDIVVDENAPLSVLIEQLEAIGELNPDGIVHIHEKPFTLKPENIVTVLESMRAARSDVSIPSTRYRHGGAEGVTINFEPNPWNKIDFCRLGTPSIFIKRSAARKAADMIKEQTSVVATNIDEIIAAATKAECAVHLFPDITGDYDGDSRWHFSRALRNRQVRLLTARLPADIANMYRVYCGLQDERARLISAQPVISSIKRLLRIIDRVRPVAS